MPLSASADCKGAAERALAMCKTETMTSVAQSKVATIEKNFRPTNGRMSPESCQGFRDAYEDFKTVVDDYISNCNSETQKARQACLAVDLVSDPSKEPEFYEGIKLTGEALKKLPNLEHYKPPMDTLNQRLNDCLIHTPGRIVNTDTDRGDASVSSVGSPNGSTSAAAGANGGRVLVGGAEANQTVHTNLRSLCGDPALRGSSFCSSNVPMTGPGLDSENSTTGAAERPQQLRTNGVQSVSVQSDVKRVQSEQRFDSRDVTASQQRGIGTQQLAGGRNRVARRMIASVGNLSGRSRRMVADSRTSLFELVQRRYQQHFGGSPQ